MATEYYSNPFLRSSLGLDDDQQGSTPSASTGGGDEGGSFLQRQQSPFAPTEPQYGQGLLNQSLNPYQPSTGSAYRGAPLADNAGPRAEQAPEFSGAYGPASEAGPSFMGTDLRPMGTAGQGQLPPLSEVPSQIPGQPAAAPTPAQQAMPPQERQERQRRRGGFGIQGADFGLNPNIRYTNQDFYSSPQFPQMYDTGIAGDPVWTAAAARVPMGLIANRLAQVQEKENQLNQWVQGRAKQFEGKAAPIYEVKYQQYVSGELDNWFKNIADTYYGGNMNKAYRAVYKDPELRSQYDGFVRNLQSIGVANKTLVDSALAVKEGVAKNERYVSDQTLNSANEVLSGALNFDRKMSAAERADKVENFQWLLTFDKYWQDSVLKGGRLKEAIKSIAMDPDYITVGGKKFFRQRAEEATAQVKEEAKRGMRAYYRVMEGDPLSKRIDEFVDANIGQAIEEKYKQISEGKGGGDGGGDKQKRTFGTSLVPMQIVKRETGEKSASETISITPYFSGKSLEKLDVAPKGGNTPSLRLMAPTLMYFPGSQEWKISGQSVNEKVQRQISDLTRGEDVETFLVEMPEGFKEEEYKKNLSEVRKLIETNKIIKDVPISNNSSALKEYWGSSDPNEVASMQTGGKYTADQVRSMVKTPQGRRDLAAASGAYVESGGLPSGATRPAISSEGDAVRSEVLRRYPNAINDPTHGWIVRDSSTGKYKKIKISGSESSASPSSSGGVPPMLARPQGGNSSTSQQPQASTEGQDQEGAARAVAEASNVTAGAASSSRVDSSAWSPAAGRNTNPQAAQVAAARTSQQASSAGVQRKLGVLRYEDVKYEGELLNGKEDGQGQYTWPKGNKYIGQFKNGMMEGQGEYTYADGRKYKGQFKNGDPVVGWKKMKQLAK